MGVSGRHLRLILLVATAALALAGMGLWAPPTLPPTGLTERPLRVGVTIDLERADEGAVAATLDAIAASGLTWVRQRFPWAAIEPQPGVYDWARWDRLVDGARARGLRVIAVLDGSPTWARPAAPDNPFAPPHDLRSFGRFASALAARYGDRIDSYQIWDEPNIQPHWTGAIDPTAYVALLREGALAVRQAAPRSRVLAAALAPTLELGPYNVSDIRFLREMYDAGAAPWFDVLAAQPFGFAEPPGAPADPNRLNFARVALLRAEMERAGDAEKPIWAVRFGWRASAQQVAWTAEGIRRAHNEWPWLGALLWPAWQPEAPSDDPAWGYALIDRSGKPAETLTILAAQGMPVKVATAGRYTMDHPALRWEGRWRQAAGAADVGQSDDAVSISFEGTRLDLQVQRGAYWGLLRVTVDGQPANALPRDSAGRANLILYDPQARAAWVTVARGLPAGPHQARLVAEGGWGSGRSLALPSPTSRRGVAAGRRSRSSRPRSSPRRAPSGFRPPASGFRLLAPGFRPPASGFRLPASGFWSPLTMPRRSGRSLPSSGWLSFSTQRSRRRGRGRRLP
jgi:hypothetical protein